MKVNSTQVNTSSSFAQELKAMTPQARVGALKYLFQKCPKLGVALAIESETNPIEVISAIKSYPKSIIYGHSHILSITKYGKNILKEDTLAGTDLIETRKQQIDSLISDFRKKEGTVPSDVYLSSDYDVRDKNVTIRAQVESHHGISKKSLGDFKKLASETLYFFPDAVVKNLYPECLDDDGKKIKKEFRNKLPENLLTAYENKELLKESEVTKLIENLTGNPHSIIYRAGLNQSNFDSFNQFSSSISKELGSALSAITKERIVKTSDNKTQIKLVVEKDRIEIARGSRFEININGQSHSIYRTSGNSYIVIDNANATCRKLEEHEKIIYGKDIPSSKVMQIHQPMGGKQRTININKLKFINSGTYYDEKKNRIYSTDGKKMYPIFNPFKNKDGNALLFMSVSLEKKLISPAESGIRIGRKVIKLPENLPVTIVKSAVKVGSSTVIVFESGSKLVQLILNKEQDSDNKNETIKLTILNPNNIHMDFNKKSGVMSSVEGRLQIKVKNDGTVERVPSKFFAEITSGAKGLDISLIDNTYHHVDSHSLVISQDMMVDIGDPLITEAKEKLKDVQQKLGLALLVIGSNLKYAIADKRNIDELTKVLPIRSDDEYPVPGALFFAEQIRQEEIKKGNYDEMPTPEDVKKIVEYINLKKGKSFSFLKFSKPSLPELIPESDNPSKIEPGHDLKEKYGMSISPRYKGLIIGSVLQFETSKNAFLPVNIPKVDVGNGHQVTFSGEFDKQIQLKHPPNSQIVNVLVDGQPVEIKPNKLGAYILDLDKKSKVSYTIAISDNLAAGENLQTTSLNLPDDPKILKIVEKAKEISDIASRIDYIKKEYAKISVYKINKKTIDISLKTRFDNMKKGKYYYGVCADHAVLGHAILAASGLNAVVLTGNSCNGKKVITSPGHACNGVQLTDGRIIQVDLTPAKFNLKTFFNFLNLIEKKDEDKRIKIVNTPTEIITESVVPDETDKQEVLTNPAPKIELDINTAADRLIVANNEMARVGVACFFAKSNSDERMKLEAEFQEKAVIYHEVLHDVALKIPTIAISVIEQILKSRVIRDSELENTRQELITYLTSGIKQE